MQGVKALKTDLIKITACCYGMVGGLNKGVI